MSHLSTPLSTVAEVATLKAILGPSVPVIVDVYASGHSGLGTSTPEYVEEVMRRAICCADGVHIYCHHTPRDGSQKAQVIKRLFHEWSSDSPAETATVASVRLQDLPSRPLGRCFDLGSMPLATRTADEYHGGHRRHLSQQAESRGMIAMAKREGSRSRTYENIDEWLEDQPRQARRRLRSSLHRLQRLYRNKSERDDFTWWHDVGSLVAELIPKGDRHYGDNVIKLLVQHLEPDRSPDDPRYFLYKARDLADKFTREEASELTRAGLPKCHLKALLSEKDKTQRQRLWRRCLEQGWSYQRLCQEIQNGKGRKRSGAGRKPKRPKRQSAGVALPNICLMAGNWTRNHAVWFDGASCPFRTVSRKDCDEAILKDAQLAVRKLKEMQGAIKDGLGQLNSFIQELKERLPA